MNRAFALSLDGPSVFTVLTAASDQASTAKIDFAWLRERWMVANKVSLKDDYIDCCTPLEKSYDSTPRRK